ncbi:hypothetical protein [Streptomyces sp. NPDC059398]|uniref:hypothetical protein n=1 Tax=Streptomyces sp. NPDC059398 TaxID=3346820 RepID=UPI00369F859D
MGRPATGMLPAAAVYFFARDPQVSLTPENGSPESSPPGRPGRTGAAVPGVAGAAPPPEATDTGHLVAVPRPPSSGTDPVSYAVRQLADGPTTGESDELTTALPPVKHPSRITVENGRNADTVVIRFPAGTARLTDPALQQLACTAARAHRLTQSQGGQSATTGPALPAPPTEAAPTGRGPVEIRVTDRRRGGGGKPGKGWDTGVTDGACPS